MTISFLPTLSYLSALCSGLLLLLFSHPPTELKWRNHEAALFIFGDSIFDSGTNDYINTTAAFRANFIPYGETFFKYPTGRFSDGRLIPDFIAEYMGLPLIPPYMQPNYKFDGGANFASGGSGALVGTSLGYAISLGTQLQQFEKLGTLLKKEIGDQKANETISKALYLFDVGGTDLMTTYWSSSDLSYEGLVAMVVGNVTTVIKNIHSKGGRKFGFLSLAPFGCDPESRATTSNGTCVDDLNLLAKIYNVAFQEALEKLETQLDGFKYSIFNMYDTVLQRINNPSAYGFEEGKKACCGSGAYNGNFSCGGQRGEKEYELCKDPSKYVYFDSEHPTQRAYQQLAELLWDGGYDVVGPYNLKDLFNA